MNETSDVIYAVLEGVPDRVLALRPDCHEMKLRTSQVPLSPIITFRRTPSRMMSGEEECVIFMRRLELAR